MLPYRCLILDLDGTVLDSHAYTFAAVRHACQPFVAPPDDGAIHARFGPDERIILRSFVGAADADAAYARLQHYYAEHAHEVRLHAAVPPLLEACRRAGVSRGLFTGRGKDSAHQLLRATALQDHFDAVVAGDEARPKPAPDGILLLLQQLGRRAGETLVVGDSPLDLQAAAAAGAAAALATWFARGVTASDIGARRLGSPSDLWEWLALSPPGA